MSLPTAARLLVAAAALLSTTACVIMEQKPSGASAPATPAPAASQPTLGQQAATAAAAAKDKGSEFMDWLKAKASGAEGTAGKVQDFANGLTEKARVGAARLADNVTDYKDQSAGASGTFNGYALKTFALMGENTYDMTGVVSSSQTIPAAQWSGVVAAHKASVAAKTPTASLAALAPKTVTLPFQNGNLLAAVDPKTCSFDVTAAATTTAAPPSKPVKGKVAPVVPQGTGGTLTVECGLTKAPAKFSVAAPR